MVINGMLKTKNIFLVFLGEGLYDIRMNIFDCIFCMLLCIKTSVPIYFKHFHCKNMSATWSNRITYLKINKIVLVLSSNSVRLAIDGTSELQLSSFVLCYVLMKNYAVKHLLRPHQIFQLSLLFTALEKNLLLFKIGERPRPLLRLLFGVVLNERVHCILLWH